MRRNRRNGRTPKTVRANLGEITIDTPRDRNGTFEPLLIPKHQRQVTGFEEKIIALYAKGMSTRDIQEILQDLYGVEVSATLISDATAAIDAEVSALAFAAAGRRSGQSSSSTALWSMCATPTAASARTRSTWPWA